MTAIVEHSDAFLGEGRVELACFAVNERLYAVDVAQVREIVRVQPVTPMPLAPELIEGVVDLRGRVTPIVDLGRVLGDASVEERPSARIALLEVDGLRLGLRVDAASEVMSVEAQALEDPPELATQAGCDVLRAVVRRPGATPVMVLSLEHILERIYRSALFPGNTDSANPEDGRGSS